MFIHIKIQNSGFRINRPKSHDLFLLFCLIIFSSITNYSPAQDEWQLINSKNKKNYYTRLSEGSDIKEVKIEGIISADLNSVITALNDVENYTNWVYKCIKSKKLDTDNINQYKYYTQTDLPFPLDNRDLIAFTTQWIDKDNNWISRSISYPDYLPESDNLVRVQEFNSLWKIRALNSTSVEFEYIIALDPGGYLPAWLVNMGVAIGPTKTINELEKRSIELMNKKYN